MANLLLGLQHLNDLHAAAQLGLPAAHLGAPPPAHAAPEGFCNFQLLLPGFPHVAQHCTKLLTGQPGLGLLLLLSLCEQPLVRAWRCWQQVLH